MIALTLFGGGWILGGVILAATAFICWLLWLIDRTFNPPAPVRKATAHRKALPAPALKALPPAGPIAATYQRPRPLDRPRAGLPAASIPET